MVTIKEKITWMGFHVISYFGHRCIKFNCILISLLTGEGATQNVQDLLNFNLWTFKKLKRDL